MKVALFTPASSPCRISTSSVLKASFLCPAQIHPEHHLRPVLGLGTAGPGMNADDGVIKIILSAQHLLELKLRHLLLNPPGALLKILRPRPLLPPLVPVPEARGSLLSPAPACSTA